MMLFSCRTTDDADLDQKLIYDFCESNIKPQEEELNVTADWEYIKKFMVRVSSQ